MDGIGGGIPLGPTDVIVAAVVPTGHVVEVGGVASVTSTVSTEPSAPFGGSTVID